MSDLESLIVQAIELKQGDKEFALFSAMAGGWEAMIGNTCRAVYIGEAQPEFNASGVTPCEAVQSLIEVLQEAYKQ